MGSLSEVKQEPRMEYTVQQIIWWTPIPSSINIID